MEKDEDMIEGGSQLICQDLQFDIIIHHRQDILFDHHQTLSRKPQNVMKELTGRSIARRVSALVPPGSY